MKSYRSSFFNNMFISSLVIEYSGFLHYHKPTPVIFQDISVNALRLINMLLSCFYFKTYLRMFFYYNTFHTSHFNLIFLFI